MWSFDALIKQEDSDNLSSSKRDFPAMFKAKFFQGNGLFFKSCRSCYDDRYQQLATAEDAQVLTQANALHWEKAVSNTVDRSYLRLPLFQQLEEVV
jgi:hypothetical protein